VYNTRRPIFGDTRVRRALAYAFDFDWMNKNLFFGTYTRTRSFFSNSELASRGLPGPDELKLLEPFRGKIPDEVFTREYQPPDGSNQREAAREALGSSGRQGEVGGPSSSTPRPGEAMSRDPSPIPLGRIAPAKSLERLSITARAR
jgi:microcin C transport system substrate-binding protein